MRTLAAILLSLWAGAAVAQDAPPDIAALKIKRAEANVAHLKADLDAWMAALPARLAAEQALLAKSAAAAAASGAQSSGR